MAKGKFQGCQFERYYKVLTGTASCVWESNSVVCRPRQAGTQPKRMSGVSAVNEM